MLNYILLERLFFLPEPGQIHVFDKNQTSDIIKHLPTPFLVCSCLSAQAYTPYLVGIDMERSLRRSEPPMPGPPGLRTRRARLMAAWSITSSDFWRWFTGRSLISLKQLTVRVTQPINQLPYSNQYRYRYRYLIGPIQKHLHVKSVLVPT